MRKIKVIHPITRLIVGGAQQNTVETCTQLNRDRFAAHIITGPQTGTEGELISEVRARGIPLTILPALVRAVDPIKDFLAVRALVQVFKNERPQIVHTHSSKAGILGRWAARIARVPIIVHTVHGWGHHEHQNFLIRNLFIFLERKTAAFTDRLIAVSDLTVKKGLDAAIGTEALYTTIHSSINLDDFTVSPGDPLQRKQALGINQHSPVVGTVSRFSPQKNPLDFVRMAALVKKEVPDCKFLFIGDGPLREETERLIKELHLSHDVVLTGLRMDIPELLHCMDVFTLTSLWEGLPRVIPQAMAAGLPVVANQVDGSAEVIRDGSNGFLVQPHDVFLMAERVVQLLKNPGMKKALGRKGQELASKEFSLKDMVGNIELLYEELLQKKGVCSS